MAQTKKTRSAAGNGNIRKQKDGTWEGRYTVGTDPKNGKQLRRSIYGKTQKEVRERLRQITSDVDTGEYVAPCAMKFSEWLDIWLEEYLTGRSPLTVSSYRDSCKNHIKPFLGRYRLDAITPVLVQKFVNKMLAQGLAAKTVKKIHGVLHRALQQAVLIGYLRTNPADVCNLPKARRAPVKPLSDEQIAALVNALDRSGHPYADLYIVTLFTGMRQGEVLGLGWEDVDFRSGTILVHRQLRRLKERGAGYDYAEPKDHASRVIKPAPCDILLGVWIGVVKFISALEVMIDLIKKKNRTFSSRKSAKFWRRRRDLNSRAGFPTYSLSRGAPSPAWVRLHVKCVVWMPACKVSGAGGMLLQKQFFHFPPCAP